MCATNDRTWAGLTAIYAILCCGYAVRAGNIAVSGFNEDVVSESGPTPFAHRFDHYGASLLEQGVRDANGQIATVGMPVSRTFVSQTGSGVTYELQPYDANNALRMGDDDPATGTMMVTPGRYSALHILAGSGTDSFSTPPLNQAQPMFLDFADGSVTASFKAYDWGYAQSEPYALGNMARNFFPSQTLSSRTVNINYGNPQNHAYTLWETTVDLSALGASGRVLQDIRFVDNFPTSNAIDVMAIDGIPVPVPGDANGDRKVDFVDLLILAQNYGKSGGFPQGDFNADGSVGFDDLLLLAQNYGQSAALGTAAVVPEPSTLAALLTGLVLVVTRRRRRET
jgi:hypothetical protein